MLKLNFSRRQNGSICVKTLLRVCVFIILFFKTASCLAQQDLVYSEAPVIVRDGVRMSTQITVNFKSKVFDLESEKVEASIGDMENSFNDLKTVLEDLQQRFGPIVLRKQIPSAVWGDVWRTHRVTKEPVRIHEWSQLFYMIFEDFVPIDSIIDDLINLPVVDYAHEPIYAIPDVAPNDPEYQNQPDKQWNLFKFQAANAWDITRGNATLRIGMVECNGLPYRDHVDFWTGPSISGTSKFDDGQNGSAYHSTMVAGVIGAATDDQDGIASLGWNLIMNTYSFTSNSGLGQVVWLMPCLKQLVQVMLSIVASHYLNQTQNFSSVGHVKFVNLLSQVHILKLITPSKMPLIWEKL